MVKKSWLIVALLVTAMLLAACTGAGGGQASGPQLPTKIGPGEGKVSIVAWAGYIERGDNDKNYDWVTGFEKETGCVVEVKTAGTSDEMVALMNQGGYDLVTASGDASLRLVYGGTVQPINTDLIPSYKNVDDRLKNAQWHTVDKDKNGTPEHYGTPYQWGPNVLMYNTETFTTPPDSWGVLFEAQDLPDGKPNKGRVEAYDGPIYIADAALYLKSKDPSLGITDPYALDQKQFDAVISLLKGQKELIFRYWHDVNVQIQDFQSEGVVASGSWPYQVNLLAADSPVSSVVPKEGATGWADTTMLATKAEHPNCAYMWMEHSLDPKVQGDVASWFGSVPAVPAACQAGASLIDEAGCKANGIDDFDKIAFWKTPTSDCFGTKAEGSCVAYDDWVKQYTAIIGSGK